MRTGTEYNHLFNAVLPLIILIIGHILKRLLRRVIKLDAGEVMSDTDTKTSSAVVIDKNSPPASNYGYLVEEDCIVGNNRSITDDDERSEPMNTGSSDQARDRDRVEVRLKTDRDSDTSDTSSSSSSSTSTSRSRSQSGKEPMEYIVKLRGLPWSCTKDDIIDFFGSEVKIHGDTDGIHMISTPDGKASGEAVVELASEDDQDVALKKDKRNMGHRYVEVFKITKSEMDWVLKRNRPVGSSNGSFNGGRMGSGSCDTYVRLRGLPYECTKEDIYHFFQGLEIVSNGIQLMVDGMGRSSGEAYVQFTSKDQAHKALGKDREMIRHRYVELFTVAPSELRSLGSMVTRSGRSNTISSRSGPYDRPGGRRDSSSKYDGGRPSSRHFKGRGGYDNDSWSSNYESWGGGGRSSVNPQPLLPGLKRGRGDDGNTRHCVLMRGLPYRAEESDIRKFFSPLSPTAVHIIYESSGRPSGTAKVNFSCNDDVTRAMAKHKDRMEHRYIELFVHRT